MRTELIERLVLRGIALTGKFLLAICIAKYIGLAAIGVYGLAVGFAVVGTKLFGLGFSAEINRRLGHVGGRGIILVAGRISAVYGLSYLLVGSIVLIALRAPIVHLQVSGVGGHLWLIFCVVIVEHLSFELNSYVFSLHKPKLGSWLLFMRTGGWSVVAIAALVSAYSTGIGDIFRIWIFSDILVVSVAACVLVHEYFAADVNLGPYVGSIVGVWRGGYLFFISISVISAMQYLERFLASPHLSQDQLGRYVFVWSVANALQTISNAAIVVVTTPRLAKWAGMGDRVQYSKVLKSSLRTCLALTFTVAIVIVAMFRPVMNVAHIGMKSGDVLVMIMLLFSFMIRSVCDIFVAAAIATCSRISLLFATGLVATLGGPMVWWMCQMGTGTYVALSHLLVSVFMLLSLYYLIIRPSRGFDLNTEASAAYS